MDYFGQKKAGGDDDDDLYEGFNYSIDLPGGGPPGGAQPYGQAPGTAMRGMPPGTAMRGGTAMRAPGTAMRGAPPGTAMRGPPSRMMTGRLQTGANGAGGRPVTSNRAAGYKKFDPLNQGNKIGPAPALASKSDNSPEDMVGLE